MSRARPTRLYSQPTGAHSLRARSLRAHRLRARSSLRALIAYGHRLPTGFHSLRARRQPTVRRVASGSSTAALVLFVRLLVALRRRTLARTPADEGGGAVDHTAQARRRGLRVSPGVVGRRGNRGAYVPRVRCVVPIGRMISPYHSIRVPCARRPVKGTYERIPWYPLYVPRGGDHPRMYPARATTDGAYHHSMKRRQHETGTSVHNRSNNHTPHLAHCAHRATRALF